MLMYLGSLKCFLSGFLVFGFVCLFVFNTALIITRERQKVNSRMACWEKHPKMTQLGKYLAKCKGRQNMEFLLDWLPAVLD